MDAAAFVPKSDSEMRTPPTPTIFFSRLQKSVGRGKMRGGYGVGESGKQMVQAGSSTCCEFEGFLLLMSYTGQSLRAK